MKSISHPSAIVRRSAARPRHGTRDLASHTIMAAGRQAPAAPSGAGEGGAGNPVRCPPAGDTVHREPQVDERTLIVAAAAGDREAFSGLVRLHQARLRALVALSLSERDDVLDVVQEAFVDAWRGLDQFDQTREFGPWLRTICRNRTLKFMHDRLPKCRRELALVDELLIAAMPTEEVAEGRLQAMRRCLEQLAVDHRRLLQQRFAEGVAVQDLAVATGKSPNAVSMILLRLKSAVQRCAAGAAP